MTRTPDQILDELLVLNAQDGDSDALQQLVTRWNARLLRHAWHLTHDRDTAADSVQEAWVDIVRSIKRLADPTAFRAWAFRIVSNKATDALRRSTRQARLLEQAGSVSQNDAPDHESSRHEPIDRQALLRNSIRKLPADRRAILSMKYLDQMSINEIANAFGIPPGTVKSRLHHAREQLKQILERCDNE